MEMRALIVDDEHLARERMRELLEEHAGVAVVGEARSGPEAIRLVESLQPDLVLLDIALQSMDGFDVLSCLDVTTPPLVIFTTAYDQHAVRAFEVQAIDYLLKPVERPRLAEALRRARTRMDLPRVMQRSSARILVRDRERIVVVRASDIDTVTAVGNYVRIQRGTERFLLRQTLASMEERLGQHGFVRIQRSVLINVERVLELQRHSKDTLLVVLTTGAKFRLSPTYRQNLEQAFG